MMFYSKSTGGFYSTDIHGDAMPDDVVEITDALHAELLTAPSQGRVIVVDRNGMPSLGNAEVTLDQRIAMMLRKVDEHLDAAARQRRYDDIRSAALRAAFPGPWHAEGVAFATWMDSCYAHCYAVLAQLQGGLITEPTEAELIASLPPLVLPA